MSVRGKFTLTAITSTSWSPTAPVTKTLKFSTTYDPTIPEDVRFSKATPTGHLEMVVDNPAALEQFELGRAYYLDFTPVPEPTPESKAAE